MLHNLDWVEVLRSLVALECCVIRQCWLDWVEVLCRCLVWLVIMEPPQGSPPSTRLCRCPRLGRVAIVVSVLWSKRAGFNWSMDTCLPPMSRKKVLGMSRNYRKRGCHKVVAVEACVRHDEQKQNGPVGGLLACMCRVYHGADVGVGPKRVSNVAELAQETGVWWIRWSIGTMSSPGKERVVP